jgi:amidase
MIPPIYRFTMGLHPPARTIRAGDLVEVDLPDSDGLGPDLKQLPPSLFDLKPGGHFPGNPVYGPIAVRGAQPGDALEVHFLHVQPNRSIARTRIAPRHGYLPDHLLRDLRSVKAAPRRPTRMCLWKLGKTTARLINPFGRRVPRVPIAPFLGCIGTAHPGRKPLSTLEAGSHGGNIDLPDLQVGTKLWLPVSVPGGLLYLGDMHAAQGQGEIVGGGLEVSGSVRIRVALKKNARLRHLRFRNSQGFGCVTPMASIEEGVRQSLAELIQWHVEDGWDRNDAYMAISQSCEFHLGGVCSRYAVVACFVRENLVS